MINERERGLHTIFAYLTGTAITAHAILLYGLFYVFYPGLNPAYWAYGGLFLSIMIGFVFEATSRPEEFSATSGRGFGRQRRNVSIRQWLSVTVALTLLLVITRDTSIARSYILIFIITLYPLLRLINNRGYAKFIQYMLARSSHWRMRTIMIGPGDWLTDIHRHLENLAEVIDNGATYEVSESCDYPQLEEWILQRECDLLILPARMLPEGWIVKLIALGERKGYRVWLPVEFSRRYGRRFNLQRVGSIDVLTPPSHPLTNTFNRMLKRGFDIAFSLPVIVFVLWPLMFVVWIIQLRNSKGPLFFRQNRMGENGKIFEVIKFRTMHVNNHNEAQQACKDDPRIYPGGNFLRKYSLDEFPQFLNVLRGEMSIVGPRPHLEIHEREFEKCYARYGLRRLVKPGVTGLAQLHGYRGEVKQASDARARARYDLIYLENWNMRIDLKIILGTVWQVIRPHHSAY